MYPLEKFIWNDADFDRMGWHDCPIHGIAFNHDDHQIMIDIDYIFEWKLSKNKRNFKFWIAPCTLVFDYVSEVVFEAKHCQIVVDTISREVSKAIGGPEMLTEYTWIIETTAGELSLKGTGYQQYVRKAPVLIAQQILTLEQRGGISFSLETVNI